MIDHIYLDIETIPSQKEGVFASILERALDNAESEIALIQPPKTLKKEETIAEWWATEAPLRKESILRAADAAANEEYERQSFNGGKGQIAVIGFAINDAEPITLYHEDYTNPAAERALLHEFYGAVRDVLTESRGKLPTFVGHNVNEFDLRFIKQRSIVLGIEPPAAIPFDEKPWGDRVYDTMSAWGGFKNRTKLSELVEIFDLQAKGSEIGEDIDGSMVWEFVRNGRIADVAKYCAGDVIRTRELHKRFTFQKTN